jgi:LysM repeat protein
MIMNYPTADLEETMIGEHFEYVVKKGDTLYQIAKKYDTTVADIMEINGLTTTNLSIGQLLVIPKRKEEAGDFEQYLVEAGDTLYSIAKATGITVDELIQINSLASNTIYPGQVLLVPKRVPSGAIYIEEYMTEPNDTIETIARKLGVNAEILGFYNDFAKLKLAPNQSINIPRRSLTYTVAEGDTPESITTRHKLAYRELVEFNSDQWLKPGTKIKVG